MPIDRSATTAGLAPERFAAYRGPAVLRRIAGLAAATAAALLLAACGSTPTQPSGSGAAARNVQESPTEWKAPILFSTRLATASPGMPALGTGVTEGRAFAFVSPETPAVAAALARQMRAAGLKVVDPGTPDAVEVRVELQAWLMPPGSHGRTRADIDMREPINAILADGSKQLALLEARASGQGDALRVPLGGWKTQIGQTNMSAGLLGFLLENAASATGVRRRINNFMGADATGTICLGTERTCIRSKGPQQDFILSGTYSAGGQEHSVTARLLMIQPEANILQPLAYAIADWRNAGLGRPTPDCDYYKSGKRVPACEPVQDNIALKDLL